MYGSPYTANLVGAFAEDFKVPYFLRVGNGQTFARIAVAVFLHQLTHEQNGIAGRGAALQCHAGQFFNHEHSFRVPQSIPSADGRFSHGQLLLIQARISRIQKSVGMFGLRNLSFDGRFSHGQLLLVQARISRIQKSVGMFGLWNLSFYGQFRLVVDRFRVHASVVNVHHRVVGKICCRYYVYPRTVPAVAGVARHDRAVG